MWLSHIGLLFNRQKGQVKRSPKLCTKFNWGICTKCHKVNSHQFWQLYNIDVIITAAASLFIYSFSTHSFSIYIYKSGDSFSSLYFQVLTSDWFYFIHIVQLACYISSMILPVNLSLFLFLSLQSLHVLRHQWSHAWSHTLPTSLIEWLLEGATRYG